MNYADQENVWVTASCPAMPENFILRFLGTQDIRGELSWVKAHNEIISGQPPCTESFLFPGSKTQWRPMPPILS